MNPYQAPNTTEVAVPAAGESFQAYAEEVRRQHLGQEAQIKSIGSLYYLGAIVSIIGVAVALIGKPLRFAPEVVAGIAVTALFIPIQFFVGYGLTHLRNWARIVALVFAFLGLLAFPVGTVICVIVIILLLLKKNTMIFSPEYKEIIAATPHIKRKISIVFKIALVIFALIILLALAGLAVALINPRS